MKISTKITFGYAILIGLMAGVLAYEIFALHRMQSISRSLSGVNFRTAITSLQLMRERDLVEEYTQKYFALGDDEYVEALQRFQSQFDATLREVKTSGRASNEQQEIGRLEAEWRAFKDEFALERRKVTPGNFTEFPPGLQRRLETLRTRINDVYQATLVAIDSEVRRSNQTGRRAETVTWAVSAVALVVSCLVPFILTRSIARPLSNLTEGTHRIAKGQFDYRLDVSRQDEFAQLARDFNSMTRRLNELDQMKRDFVSHVSHELKAPLASIRETLQLLLDELPGPLTLKQKRLLEINLQCARRLSSMIGNLLDLSRMEAGMMEYELNSNNLAVLVRTTVAEFEPQAREKDIRLEMRLPDYALSAHCDADRILQVLGNVLSNAIKFSPEGGRIEIRSFKATALPTRLPESWQRRMTSRGQDGGFIVATITDSGPGIPPPLRERVFEKFHQVQHTKELKGQSVGLGLAICRTIVQAHQGAIWVEENPGGGCIFLVLLPAATGSDVTRRVSGPI
jgi:signal transduction histidine kinase